jgi:hypothetical protein
MPEERMKKMAIHGIEFIQTWGDSTDLLKFLKYNGHVISIFHIMGRHSYLVNVNFDDKAQMEKWIAQVKSLKLGSGVPAVIAIQSNKVIDVYKQKEEFSLKDYSVIGNGFHMFMMIDNPGDDAGFISLMKETPIVQAVLHVQGEHSFVVELITDDYERYKDLLKKVKALQSVERVETQEVISVPKYRNRILDESGNLVAPVEDIRQLYVL